MATRGEDAAPLQAEHPGNDAEPLSARTDPTEAAPTVPADSAPTATDVARFLPSGEEAGSAPEDRGFRPDVEGLRAVAILLVVLFHIGFRRLQGGFVGVDVFFVVSGFVITGLLLRERQATGRNAVLTFYARRARRILPAALLVIVVSLVATDLFVSHANAVLVAGDARWTALFVGNIHFSLVFPNYVVVRPASPLQHYWSLAVEEQFYLVYPALFALLALMTPPGRPLRRAPIAAGLLGIVGISLLASVITSKPGQLAAYDSPFTRAWELALGALVAVAAAHLTRLPKAFAAVVTWIGLAMIVVAALTLTLLSTYPGYLAVLPVAGTALVIAGGTAVPRWGAERLLGLPPMRALGRVSYSWYLWHVPLLVLVAQHDHTSFPASPVAKNLVLCLIALGLAIATYFLVENPVRHWRWLVDRPGTTLAAAAALVASCVVFTYAF